MKRLDHRRTWRSERGANLVEFALASTVFFMTVFGTISFGLAVYRYNIISDLAQEGARWASVRGSTSSTPASSADVSNFVQTRALGMTPTVTTTWPSGGSPANAPGNLVQVVVSQAFSPISSYVPAGTLTLTSTAQMIIAR